MRLVSKPLLSLVLLATASTGFAPVWAAGTALPAIDSLVTLETRIRWQPGVADSAIVRAAREGRPAFLDFYADWCAPCRWMDRAVYNDPLLGEVAEDVAMVRIDIDRPAGRALATRYGVVQYPTLVYVAPDGREVLRWPGPLSLRDTRLNLGQLAVPASGRAAVEAARAYRPDDISTQARLLLWYGMRGEVERVRAIVDSLERGRSGGGADSTTNRLRPGERVILQLSLAKAEEVAGRTARALAAYQRAEAAEPDGVFAWRAWLGISTCLEATGDLDGAGEAATRSLALNPQRWLGARVERLALAARQPALPTPPGVDAP